MNLWILTMVAALAIAKGGDCLQCYACENCTDICCIDPSYCGPIITTEPTTETSTFSTPVTGPTTVPPNESSTVSMVRYACYKTDVKVKDKTIKKRGCSEFLVGENACQLIYSNPLVEASSCETCNEDGCNASSALHQPLTALFGIYMLRYVFYQIF